MKTLACALAVTCAAGTALAAGKDVDIKAPDGTVLKATYTSPGAPGPGIMLFHMCNSDRKAWAGLAEKLARKGFHTLALDYRGYGESGGKRHTAEPVAEQRRLVVEAWPGDVDAALEHFVALPGVDAQRLGAAGGSCGVHQAIQLARRHPEVRTVVLLAGQTDRAGEELLARSTMPVFGVAARDDDTAADAMAWNLGFSSHRENQLKIYDKGGHGTDLFKVHTDLEPAIVAWFEKHLRGAPPRPTAAGEPGPSVARSKILREPGGGARLLAQLREARKKKTDFTLPPEAVVNNVGYELMNAGRIDDAIQLLLLNVEAHPDSANTYDSLGDAYVAAGDPAKAAALARKAIEALAKDKRLSDEGKKLIRESAEKKLTPAAK